MKHVLSFAATLTLMVATPAFAEFSKVQSASEFKQIVTGKTLTRTFVRLTVSPDGDIEGHGLTWPVNGQWTWKNGYFCRSLEWGGDDLGYNCQEVTASGNKIRFTSDQGTGESADFSLR